MGSGGTAGPASGYYAGVAINPAKTVQAVTPPGHGSAVPSGLHIFAVPSAR